MPSPQTLSRENKIRMLKKAILYITELLTMNKSGLDSIDSRYIKKIVVQLEGWIPPEKPTTKNSS